MQELIVKTTLPTIEANFDIVKQQLIYGLKTYDVIITADTVKDGKSMASEINKIKKAIKDQEKKALEDILGPANEFKDKIKELMTLADEAREKITAQVAAYEEKTKMEIQNKIVKFTNDEVLKAELREPFIKIDILDLVKLGAVTKTGNLTTATMNVIKGRIAEQKNLQLEEDARLKAEQEEKEAEIARIREEERIKAEAKAKEEVTTQMSPPEQVQVYQQQEPVPEMINVECQISQPEGEYFNPETGEVYEVPAFMDNPREEIVPPLEPYEHINPETGEFTREEDQNKTTVKVLIDIEVDISKIPTITDKQIVDALDRKLKTAGINNAQIRDLHRF